LFSLLLFFRLTLKKKTTRAQFGVNPKANVEISADGASFDLMEDPEMEAALDMFANMGPDEMEEIMASVLEMMGDDPETRQAIQDVMADIRSTDNLSSQAMKNSLQSIMEEQAVASAMTDTLEMLAQADESTWDTILEQKDIVLEAVIESGQINDSDAERFRTDPAAWEAELKFIWSELRKQATDNV
jgi:hypothetical protein